MFICSQFLPDFRFEYLFLNRAKRTPRMFFASRFILGMDVIYLRFLCLSLLLSVCLNQNNTHNELETPELGSTKLRLVWPSEQEN